MPVQAQRVLHPRTYVEYTLRDGIAIPHPIAGRDLSKALRKMPKPYDGHVVSFRFYDRFEIGGSGVYTETEAIYNESKPFYLIDGRLIIGNLKEQLRDGVRQQTYVEYHPRELRRRPEPFVIGTRDLMEIVALMPSDMVGFRLFDRFEAQHNGVLEKSYRFNRTGFFYPDGEILWPDDYRREVPEAETKIRKMEDGRIPMVVRTREVTNGRSTPTFYEEDAVFSVEQVRELLRG